MHIKSHQLAALLQHKRTRPQGPAVYLPPAMDKLEGRQLWQEYCLLLKPTPVKKEK